MSGERPSTAALALSFVAAFVLLAVVPAFVWDALPQLGIDTAGASPAAQQELSMLGFVAACASVVLFARLQVIPVPWRPLPLAAVARTWGLFELAWVPVMLLYLWAMRAAGRGLEAQGFLVYLAEADLARPGFWLVVLGVGIAAPLAEEITFRGYLQGTLQGLLSRPLSILVASAVFGLVHTLPYALPVGMLGILFGGLFARYGSLWPSVAAHAVHNLLTVAVTVAWPGSLDLLYPR